MAGGSGFTPDGRGPWRSRTRWVISFLASALIVPALWCTPWPVPAGAAAPTPGFVMPLQEFANDGANGQLWNAYNRTDGALGPTIIGRPAVVMYGQGQEVFVRAADDDLVQYVDDDQGGRTWNAYDLTQAAQGPQIAGDPAAIAYQSVLSILARTASGDLVEFANADQGGQLWDSTDLTTVTGTAIQGDPTVLMAGSTLEVFAEAADGDLVEFSGTGSGLRTWTSTDLTQVSGGPTLSGSPGAIYFAQSTLHVYAVSSTGDLTEFVEDGSGQRPWNSYDLSAIAAGPTGAGQPSAIVYGTTVHVYLDTSGHLTEFVNDGFAGRLWNSYDLTAISQSPGISGDPAAVFYNSTIVDIFAQGPGGDLVSYVNDGYGGRLWNSYDLTEAAGGPATGADPAAMASSGAVSVFAAGPLPPSTIQSIVNNAESQDQYNLAVVEDPPGSNCNIYSGYFGRGSTAGCAPGTSSEEWCSDFAEWVWLASGIDTSGITGWSFTFVDWGESRVGAWKPGATNDPEPGDAVVWGDMASSYGDHVGIVIGVSDGMIDVVSGNSGPPIDAAGDVDAVWETGYFDPATSTSDGYPIIGYVSPTGWTGFNARPAASAMSPSDLAPLIATQDGGK